MREYEDIFKPLNFSGSVELDLGEIGFHFADCDVDYETDGTIYKITHYRVILPIKGQEIDITDLVTDSGMEVILDKFVTN